MKIRCVMPAAVCCAVLILGACEGENGGGLSGSPSRSGYSLRLPAVPAAWASILGAPVWKIEWLNGEGEKREMTITDGKRPEINLPETWTAPVLAWPHWPGRDIGPGIFRPAGALCPFDVSGGAIALSWRGGLDAALYWELARAAAETEGVSRAVPRLPQRFNWPRFRELFGEGGGINEDVRADPWLADWPSIAQKTVKSGFDKRRLIPEKRSELRVPVGPGPWAGTSPFAEPLYFEDAPVFPVRAAADTWISAEGLLRCNNGTWILRSWE
jgi:hypothetical protein